MVVPHHKIKSLHIQKIKNMKIKKCQLIQLDSLLHVHYTCAQHQVFLRQFKDFFTLKKTIVGFISPIYLRSMGIFVLIV